MSTGREPLCSEPIPELKSADNSKFVDQVLVVLLADLALHHLGCNLHGDAADLVRDPFVGLLTGGDRGRVGLAVPLARTQAAAEQPPSQPRDQGVVQALHHQQDQIDGELIADCVINVTYRLIKA